MIKIKIFLRSLILPLFDKLTYIRFLSKKRFLDLYIKKIRNIFYQVLLKNDLNPHQQVYKTFISNNQRIKIYIDTHDFSHIGQIMDPDWEEDLFKFYKKISTKENCFIDMGANVGCHSLFFTNFINCKKVIYVEPNLKCYNLFLKSLSLQDSEKIKKVEALNKIVTNDKNINTLKYFKNNSGSGSVVDYFGKKEKKNIMLSSDFEFNIQKVNNIEISELFKKFNNSDNLIIKMDIQGAEPRILEQIANYVEQHKIIYCFFEVNDFELDLLINVLKKLEGQYKLKTLDDKIIKSEDVFNYIKRIIVLERNEY